MSTQLKLTPSETFPLFRADADTVVCLDMQTGEAQSVWSIEEATRHYRNWCEDLLICGPAREGLIAEIIPALGIEIRKASVCAQGASIQEAA